MDPSSVLNATTQSFADLMANGKTYAVPPFQRDYSWTEQEWEDLWFDVTNLESEGDAGHYMGYAVLKSRDGKHFEVIDGQQRLATLSILALAVLKQIQDLASRGSDGEQNRKRFEILRNRFIGHVEATSLMPVTKLSLNKNDDAYYQSYLVQLREPPHRSRAKPSERRLQEAFSYFCDRLSAHFAARLTGERLAELLERVGDQLVFTVIQVNDDVRAYKIFETLNARGVKLSATDLLKNYLFSVVHARSPADLVEAERRWQRVTDDLGAEDFPTFARHLWNATESLTREQMLFKAIKSRVRTSEEAFDLLDRLERNAPAYVALGSPEDERWSRDERRWLHPLRIFAVTHFYPLALAALERGWHVEERARVFRMCAVIAFRWNVICGYNPNQMEKAYNAAALAVRRGEARSAGDLFALLRNVYVDDAAFQPQFAQKSIRVNNRTKKLVKYILCEIESMLAGKEMGAVPSLDAESIWPVLLRVRVPRERRLDWTQNRDLHPKEIEVDSNDVTIEHILPESPGPEWNEPFPPADQERLASRLANYTLLEASLNREAKNQTWPAKASVFRRSAFKLTSQEAAFEEWTPATLAKRADRLARLAAHVWRLDYS